LHSLAPQLVKRSFLWLPLHIPTVASEIPSVRAQRLILSRLRVVGVAAALPSCSTKQGNGER
jgi:hypothetical protein